MKLFYTDHFELPLPAGHRFPMAKYRLLRERAAAELSQAELVSPAAASDAQLLLAHAPGYVKRVQLGQLSTAEVRRIGFPWTAALVERSRRSVGATIEASRAAVAEGIAANLAGGTHHAFADCGEGFCVFNDVAVAARVAQQERLAQRVLVVDCDVHQGNGTAAILRHDASVFTVSLHGARNFPLRKQRSDLDVPLADGTGDLEYLRALRQALDAAWSHAPFDLVYYVAGADPFEQDRLGRMRLTKRGLAERDELLLDACRRRGIPAVIVMGGGYAHQVHDIVDIHLATLRIAHAALHSA